MRNHLIRVSLLTLALAHVGLAQAVEPTIKSSELPKLVQEEQHAIASRRIAAFFTHSHYKQIQLDDAFSQKVFALYLESLDYSRNLFLQSDVDGFDTYRRSLFSGLEKGDLSAVYYIFNQSIQRRYERLSYALSLLDKPFDFSQPDAYQFDRKDASWPKNTAELDELWRQRVKYDALSLKLAGKNDAEIKSLLTKRYQSAIKRLAQSESEDAFMTFENAFARSIDPHTSYLSPREADRFNSEMNISLEGIGAVLQADDDFTVVRSLVPGGPADKSKLLKPEDKITGVAQDDGKMQDIIGWRLDEVVDLIKGPKGTKVRLEIQRGEGAARLLQVVELQRDAVRLEDRAAKSSVMVAEGKKIGVINIRSFYNNLHLDVIKELEKLNQQKVDGILIDLRDNGGGALSEATDLTGLFIKSGPVVQVRDSIGRVATEEDTDGKSYYTGPLTILINRYSASASEIFSAALSDYGRALVVGDTSFGKGTVQQNRPLKKIYDFYDKELGNVQYTIAKFYRINGGSTQHKGVVPDIRFPALSDSSEIGESVEPNALPWDKIDAADYQPVGQFTKLLPSLQKRHDDRIAQEPEFRYVLEDIAWYQQEKQKKTISLNEAERIRERDDLDAKSLQRTNERLVRMGKPKVNKLSDVPAEIEFPDGYLQEAANITADLAQALKG
ncbi:MAG: carboxy terminal-processing peptidase [Aeromonadaceae bacterium]